MTDRTRVRELARKAGERALVYKAQGFLCSESVFLAVNETLRISP